MEIYNKDYFIYSKDLQNAGLNVLFVLIKFRTSFMFSIYYLEKIYKNYFKFISIFKITSKNEKRYY